MLGISQEEVCKRAQCGRKLLNDFENKIRIPSPEKISDLRRALEEAGARFFMTDIGIAVAVHPERASARSPRARALSSGF
ncbi:helix-turn-helix domain-containing protein [Microvirga tunisiensis]